MANSVASLSHRELARLITGIENNDPAAQAAMSLVYAAHANVHVVGITGAPGSGKSTLVAALTKQARKEHLRVAILSIDPSSPFSGGAILGDRIRMRDLSGDDGVFIRSMASRGAVGGLAAATADVTALLSAAGFDLIFVETVGVGQADIDVSRVADTVIVVEAPGMGDDVQAIKAGILEIADVLVVNKADHAGAEATVAALQAALDLGAVASDGWHTPILQTIATHDEGVATLLDVIHAHRTWLAESGAGIERRKRRAEMDVLSRLRDLVYQHTLNVLRADYVQAMIVACAEGRLDPATAARALFDSANTDP